MNEPSVDVITITRSRPLELMRCVQSVQAQHYPGFLRHIVVCDGTEAFGQVQEMLQDFKTVHILHADTSRYECSFDSVYVPARLAFLRNFGIAAGEGEYICYLDDDNYMSPEHISSLVGLLLSDRAISIAFSWRKLCTSDGVPFVDELFPWTPEPRLAVGRKELAAHIYSELVAGGIATPGSNVMRDAVLDSRGVPVYTVDTNEMMYSRRLHATFPNITRYAWREMVGDFSDDYALVRAWHLAGLKFQATGLATVTYTLGGTSNTGV